MKIIARIHTDFPEKFGIPRQSNLIPELVGRIVFEPEYRDPVALRGLLDYDYIWLLWEFEGIAEDYWSTVVTPPRLGGKKHMGVFATRSPFRPNHIGLSSVRLLGIEDSDVGKVLIVSGADLRDNTPIYDIKPYLPYVDSHPDARSGFAGEHIDYELRVEFPENLLAIIPENKRVAAIEVLKQDPRPAYHDEPDRKYGVAFAGFDIHFTVCEGVLRVFEVVELFT